MSYLLIIKLNCSEQSFIKWLIISFRLPKTIYAKLSKIPNVEYFQNYAMQFFRNSICNKNENFTRIYYQEMIINKRNKIIKIKNATRTLRYKNFISNQLCIKLLAILKSSQKVYTNQFQVPLNKLNFISIDTVSIRIDVEHNIFCSIVLSFRYVWKFKKKIPEFSMG